MPRLIRSTLALALLASGAAQADPFTYQGRLDVSGQPANGLFDLRFELRANDGTGLPNTIDQDDVPVVDGLFAVALDFGPIDFNTYRYLRISVRPGEETGAYVPLSPDTMLTATPLAQRVVPNSIGSAQVVDGSIGEADIAATVQRRVSGLCPAGSAIQSIGANGSVACETGLQGPAGPEGPQGAPGSADAWSRIGNAGTNPATNFIGTTDAQPFEVRANNQRVLRLENIAGGSGQTANVTAGSPANTVGSGVRGATIGGGGIPAGSNDPLLGAAGRENRVLGHYGTVAGGVSNLAGTSAFATVSGGANNQATGVSSTIGGGSNNFAEEGATVAGGDHNIASYYAFVGGGSANVADHHGVVAGGSNNAANHDSIVGGGLANTAMGVYAVVAGGYLNCAGASNSWAGGNRAKVRASSLSPADPPGYGCDGVAVGGSNGDRGTFIWADSQAADFVSTGPDQFNIRARGGVRLSGDTRQYFGVETRQMLNLYEDSYGIGVQSSTMYFRTNNRFAWFSGGSHSDATLDPGSGGSLLMTLGTGGSGTPTGTARAQTFTSLSDRAAKTDVVPVDPGRVLAKVLDLPLSEWRYKNRIDERHLGPMAQDFHAAFGLNGADDKSIATVDADGVALAAIQGLNAKLEAENAALRKRLEALEAALGIRP